LSDEPFATFKLIAGLWAEADRDDQVPRGDLVASDSDRADCRAALVHDADGPFALRPEIAVQFSQLLPHEHHSGIAGGLRVRKLRAGFVGLVRPIVEVEEVARHAGSALSALDCCLSLRRSLLC
jgi:hypothetical protein